METDLTISPLLAELDAACPSGYALPLHIRFSRPTLLFITYPPSWIEVYTQKGLVMHDPAVRWGFENLGTTTWDELEKNDPAGVLSEAKQHGMKYGTVIAIEKNGSRSIGGFSRDDRNFTDEENTYFSNVLEIIHDLTLNKDKLPPAEMAELTRLSITLSHG